MCGGTGSPALADGLGVGVNELRALGTQGELTGDKLVRALTSQLQALREEADGMPATVADAMVILQNAMTEYVGKVSEARGITALLSDSILVLADNIESVASGAAAAGLVLMAERRAQRARAIQLYVEAHMNTEEAIDIANRMSDLIDALLALQPHEVRAIGELGKSRWEGGHPDRERFLSNVRAIVEATA